MDWQQHTAYMLGVPMCALNLKTYGPLQWQLQGLHKYNHISLLHNCLLATQATRASPQQDAATHTTATPRMTNRMDPTTEGVKRRPNQKSSTTQTNGMISSLAIW